MNLTMQDVFGDISRWLAEGRTDVALATVVNTWGSAPRGIGAKMAFTPYGEAISGSVSGGCVEGAVIEAGGPVLATGQPQLLRFGVPDETAWNVGLACGGTIEVFVERLDRTTFLLAQTWQSSGAGGAIATIIRGPEANLGRKAALGDDGSKTGDQETLGALVSILNDGPMRPGTYSLSGEIDLFVDVLRQRPELVIVGGAHIAVSLAQLARMIGYRTVVIDPRRVFGNEARFPTVDQLIQRWPGRALQQKPLSPNSALVTLSHDPKIDDPALAAALASDAFYIGALGSRKTHAARLARLSALGCAQVEFSRIHAPIGMDIGADNPEEIALAIMAEIVAAHRQRESM